MEQNNDIDIFESLGSVEQDNLSAPAQVDIFESLKVEDEPQAEAAPTQDVNIFQSLSLPADERVPLPDVKPEAPSKPQGVPFGVVPPNMPEQFVPGSFSVEGLRKSGKAIAGTAKAAYYGFNEGVQQLDRSLYEILDPIFKFGPETRDLYMQRQLDREEIKNQIGKPVGAVDTAVSGISQFGTGMVVGGAPVKALGLGATATSMGAGAIADAFAFDPKESNLSAMIEKDHPGFSNWLTQLLATDPNDAPAWNRLRRAGEGILIGLGAETVMRSIVAGVKASTTAVNQTVPDYIQKFRDENFVNVPKPGVMDQIKKAVDYFSPSGIARRHFDELNKLKKIDEEATGVKFNNKNVKEGFGSESSYVLNRVLLPNSRHLMQETHSSGVPFFRGDRVVWEGPSTKDVFKALGETPDIDGFRDFLVALRAKHMKDVRGIKQPLANYDEEVINTIISEGAPKFEAALKLYKARNEKMLDLAVESGMVDKATKDRLLADNPVYIPFYKGEVDPNVQAMFPDKEFKTGQANIGPNVLKKRMKDTDERSAIADPIDSLLYNHAMIIEAAYKNIAKQSIYKNIEKIEGQKYVFELEPKDRMRMFGMDKETLAKQLRAQGIDIDPSEMPEDFFKFFTFDKIPVTQRNGLDIVMVDGKAKYYKVMDEGVKDALYAYGPKAADWFLRFADHMNSSKRLYTRATVYNPEFFMWKMPTRDSLSAGIMTQAGMQIPLKNTAFGLFNYMRGLYGTPLAKKMGFNMADPRKEFLDNGGGFGTLIAGEADLGRQSLSDYFRDRGIKNVVVDQVGIHKVAKPFQAFVSSFENATRLNEYQRLIDRGYSPVEAAYHAREVAADFSMRGSSMIWNGMLSSMPFGKSTAQGMYRSWRALKETPERVIPRAFMTVTVPSLGLWYMNKDDPTYQKLPDWQKSLFWHIPIGKENVGTAKEPVWETTFAKFPKPFDFGHLFGTGPEMMMDYLYRNGDKDTAEAYVRMLFSNPGQLLNDAVGDIRDNPSKFMEAAGVGLEGASKAFNPLQPSGFPSIPPAATAGYLALGGNTNFFTGGDVVSEQLRNEKNPESEYQPWQPLIYREVADRLGASPLRLEAITRSMLSTLGQVAAGIADPAIETWDKHQATEKAIQALEGKNLTPEQAAKARENIIRDARKYAERPARRWYEDAAWELPKTSTFLQIGQPKATQQELDFYDKFSKDALEAAKLNSRRNSGQLDWNKSKELQTDAEFNELVNKSDPVSKAQAHIAELRKAMKQIQENRDINPEEKRQKLVKANEALQLEVQKFNYEVQDRTAYPLTNRSWMEKLFGPDKNRPNPAINPDKGVSNQSTVQGDLKSWWDKNFTRGKKDALPNERFTVEPTITGGDDVPNTGAPLDGDTLTSPLSDEFPSLKHKTHDRYDTLFYAMSNKHSVDPAIVKAVAITESGAEKDPNNAKSKKGAQGIMQLMPATAIARGVKDVKDPAQNIEGGAKELSWLLKSDLVKGNLELALIGYNYGYGNLQRLLRRRMTLPKDHESYQYVQKVMALLGQEPQHPIITGYKKPVPKPPVKPTPPERKS